MQSQISEISPVFVEVSVQVPWADVEKAIQGSYAKLSKTARVKGFRQGKVPHAVLKQLFGAHIKKDVVSNLVEAGLGRAVETHKLTVVAMPPMESVPELKQGEPLSFRAKLEVQPKIEQVVVDGIELTRPSSAIPDADVDGAIERLRQQNAELVAPDPVRPALETDVLTCSYRVSIEGTERPELTAESRELDLSGGLIPELKSALLGKQPGDTVHVEVTFPKDQGGEFAGKPGAFDIEIKEIKQKVLPELDDEFAKDLEYASLDELKQKTRARLEENANERIENQLKAQLIDKLLEKNPVEAPPSLVQHQHQAMLQEYLQMIRMTGQPLNFGEDLMERTKADAERRVRAALMLGAIARLKQIALEPADLDKRLAEMAARTGKHVAKLRAEIQGEQREMLEAQMLEEKLLEYLLGQATITESAT